MAVGLAFLILLVDLPSRTSCFRMIHASVGLARAEPLGMSQKEVSIGWDSHKPVSSAPATLVRQDDGGPSGNYPMRAKFEAMLRKAQIKITEDIAAIDGGAEFKEDCWTRANGGGGLSRVLAGGKVFEKAGVNLSVVYGSMPQEALQAATERGVDRAKGMAKGERVPFFACGLSSVMHPRNPHCPTMHFNYRYFETDGGVWWFGGGTDITPCYVDEDDMRHFHGTYKKGERDRVCEYVVVCVCLLVCMCVCKCACVCLCVCVFFCLRACVFLFWCMCASSLLRLLLAPNPQFTFVQSAITPSLAQFATTTTRRSTPPSRPGQTSTSRSPIVTKPGAWVVYSLTISTTGIQSYCSNLRRRP